MSLLCTGEGVKSLYLIQQDQTPLAERLNCANQQIYHNIDCINTAKTN